jgi:hypothetical protein
VWFATALASAWIAFIFACDSSLRFYPQGRSDWERFGKLGLLATVVVLYAGHLASGTRTALVGGQLHDSETTLQRIEDSLNSLAAGKQADKSQSPTAEVLKLQQIDDQIKSLQTELKNLEAQKPAEAASTPASKPGHVHK